MPSGSCLCGDFKYQWTGEPQGVMACHCLPCRKSSGTTNSINVIAPASTFKVLSGKNLRWARKGDSGSDLFYNNCAKCGALMFVESEGMPEVKIVKLGTIDDEDVLQNAKPVSEIYTKRRLPWCPAWQGIPQFEEGPS